MVKIAKHMSTSLGGSPDTVDQLLGTDPTLPSHVRLIQAALRQASNHRNDRGVRGSINMGVSGTGMTGGR